MFGHRARLKLRSVTQVVTRASGGLLTRIDENRALLQLLLSDASRLLAKNPQVVTYLRSHDQFFVELQRTLGLVDPPEVIVARNVDEFPRPWPASNGDDVSPSRLRTQATSMGSDSVDAIALEATRRVISAIGERMAAYDSLRDGVVRIGALASGADAVQTDNALRAIVTECDALLRNSDRSVSSAAATGS